MQRRGDELWMDSRGVLFEFRGELQGVWKEYGVGLLSCRCLDSWRVWVIRRRSWKLDRFFSWIFEYHNRSVFLFLFDMRVGRRRRWFFREQGDKRRVYCCLFRGGYCNWLWRTLLAFKMLWRRNRLLKKNFGDRNCSMLRWLVGKGLK